LSNADVVLLNRNTFGVKTTVPFDDFAAADCDLVQNYVATVAGGTGLTPDQAG
jgi:hypothetical protein